MGIVVSSHFLQWGHHHLLLLLTIVYCHWILGQGARQLVYIVNKGLRLENQNLRFTKFMFNNFIQCVWFKPLGLSIVISQIQASTFKASTKWLLECHLAIVGNSQSFLVSCWVRKSHLTMNNITCLVMDGICFVFNVIAPPKSKYDFPTFVICKLRAKDCILCVQQFNVNHWIANLVVSLNL
jgi:hypothetical protein